MKNLIFKIGVLLAGASMLVSCEEKLPENKVYPYETQLISIKILNAGADGNTAWRKASQARLRSSESRTIRDTLTIS